jgi:hypothetical protein
VARVDALVMLTLSHACFQGWWHDLSGATKEHEGTEPVQRAVLRNLSVQCKLSNQINPNGRAERPCQGYRNGYTLLGNIHNIQNTNTLQCNIFLGNECGPKDTVR